MRTFLEIKLTDISKMECHSNMIKQVPITGINLELLLRYDYITRQILLLEDAFKDSRKALELEMDDILFAYNHSGFDEHIVRTNPLTLCLNDVYFGHARKYRRFDARVYTKILKYSADNPKLSVTQMTEIIDNMSDSMFADIPEYLDLKVFLKPETAYEKVINHKHFKASDLFLNTLGRKRLHLLCKEFKINTDLDIVINDFIQSQEDPIHYNNLSFTVSVV